MRECFIVFTEAAIFSEPAKSSLYNPTLREYLKAMTVTAFDNFNHTVELLFCPAQELTAVTAIGPNQLQSPTAWPQCCQNTSSPVAVLDVGRMNDQDKNQAQGIYQNMAFASLYFLTGVVTAVPPFKVLTLWLSRIPALGVGLRPSLRRTRSRRRV